MTNQKQSLRKHKEIIIFSHTILRGVYTNARSLANKMEELELQLHKEDLDFVGITETWFDSSHDWLANIEGYSLHWRDGRVEKVEGCAYISRMIYGWKRGVIL